MLTKIAIWSALEAIGLKPGEVLVLQSSVKGCGEIEGGPQGLIDALIEYLGPVGTLIMPSYNFNNWTEQHYFDILETPSKVGLVSEIFRQMPGVGRTQHPIHCLSVYGRLRSELESLDYQSSFSEEGVFAKLLRDDVLYTTFGLGDKMPFLPCHYSEAHMNVPYRRIKDFAGIYVDSNRNVSTKVYSFHVRNNSKDPVYEGHTYLVDQQKVKTHMVSNVPICYARAIDYHEDFTDYIRQYPDRF